MALKRGRWIEGKKGLLVGFDEGGVIVIVFVSYPEWN